MFIRVNSCDYINLAQVVSFEHGFAYAVIVRLVGGAQYTLSEGDAARFMRAVRDAGLYEVEDAKTFAEVLAANERLSEAAAEDSKQG